MSTTVVVPCTSKYILRCVWIGLVWTYVMISSFLMTLVAAHLSVCLLLALLACLLCLLACLLDCLLDCLDEGVVWDVE